MDGSLAGTQENLADEVVLQSASAVVAAQAISDTLRIPLAARAFGDALFPQVEVRDASARDALARLGDDGRRWIADRHSVYGVLSRTRIFRGLALACLQRHPAGHVVNLGCGLSHYFQWLDNGQARMTDADLPDVIALRRAVLGPPGERHALVGPDLCQPGWWDRPSLPGTFVPAGPARRSMA